MPNTELQNQLIQIMESSPSYLSLDAMKKGEMKMKLLSLPEEQIHQAIAVFMEEKKNMYSAEQEISHASSSVKQEGHRLHTLLLQKETDEEQEESSRSSEEILKQLTTATKKKGCMGVLAILALPFGALLLSNFFGVHLF
ncbi:hypothetical protein IT413_02545 [Candidatus Peregrinibacteria bacterium]|nr:hypothetical protein [Candidatus Peregrinibacteria bacterium]